MNDEYTLITVVNSFQRLCKPNANELAQFAEAQPILYKSFVSLRSETVAGWQRTSAMRMVSSSMKECDFKTSIKFARRSLYRWRLRRILRLMVLSAFVVMLFPFSKFVNSSTVKGLTLTPNLTMDDFSSVFSASFTTAHPILFVPKSSPRIFFIRVSFKNYAKIIFLGNAFGKNVSLPNF